MKINKNEFDEAMKASDEIAFNLYSFFVESCVEKSPLVISTAIVKAITRFYIMFWMSHEKKVNVEGVRESLSVITDCIQAADPNIENLIKALEQALQKENEV